jgi:hypothetical protein
MDENGNNIMKVIRPICYISTKVSQKVIAFLPSL